MFVLADQDIASQTQTGSTKNNTSSTFTFPAKLHQMVDDAEENDFSDVVSWNNGGSSFKVHKPTEFSDKIMPTYFNQTKYKSFQRQLNLYGFVRTHHGCHKGSYSHKNFRRGQPSLSLLHRHKLTFAKKTAVSTTVHADPSNSLSMSAFDMQAIMDFEARPTSSVWGTAECIADDSLLEPSFYETCFSEFQLFKDFFDTDDMNIAFDAGNGLNDISNDPLFQCTKTMVDPKLSSERNQSLSIFIEVEEKQVEIDVSGTQTEHSFPWKLHDMLEAAESNNFCHIVSWEPGGVSFKVHKSAEFVTKIMPLYFDQTKYESFRRQLNLYNFSRVTRGSNRGMHFHASFVKGDRSLCKEVKRQQ
jgi:hypothetical protein